MSTEIKNIQATAHNLIARFDALKGGPETRGWGGENWTKLCDKIEDLRHALKLMHAPAPQPVPTPTDTERLDWLERWMLSFARLTSPDMSGIRFAGQYHNPAKERGEAGPSYLPLRGQSVRAAIDAALHHPKEGKV